MVGRRRADPIRNRHVIARNFRYDEQNALSRSNKSAAKRKQVGIGRIEATQLKEKNTDQSAQLKEENTDQSLHSEREANGNNEVRTCSYAPTKCSEGDPIFAMRRGSNHRSK